MDEEIKQELSAILEKAEYHKKSWFFGLGFLAGVGYTALFLRLLGG